MNPLAEQVIVSISALEKYIVCPRQCALIFVEGLWADNAHTIVGTQLHERADTAGYENQDDGIKILRALPLYSKKYGLTGKADVVEMLNGQPIPVEYKKGKKKKWVNDEVQLCAQALCLEEMFQTQIEKGFIYHATSKRRREVILDSALRDITVRTIEHVRKLLLMTHVPPPELKPQCDGCSLHEACMPELSLPDFVKTNNELFDYSG